MFPLVQAVVEYVLTAEQEFLPMLQDVLIAVLNCNQLHRNKIQYGGEIPPFFYAQNSSPFLGTTTESVTFL